MFILANFIIATAQVLDFLLWAYLWILIARVVMSWIDADPYNPIVRFIYNLTEPVLEKVRERLPLFAGGFDLSPIVVSVAIWFIKAISGSVALRPCLYIEVIARDALVKSLHGRYSRESNARPAVMAALVLPIARRP